MKSVIAIINDRFREIGIKILAWPQVILGWAFAMPGVPTNVNRMPFLATPPEGMALAHRARSGAEADFLRQVLVSVGFHPEYVPGTAMGVFGVHETPYIFVPREEAQEAAQFLTEYLAAEPMEEE